MREFEWDENKRWQNLLKHFLDFIDAPIVFEGNLITGLAKMVNREQREIATGMLDDVYVTVVFVGRGEAIRIISFRRARDGERRKHREVFGD